MDNDDDDDRFKGMYNVYGKNLRNLAKVKSLLTTTFVWYRGTLQKGIRSEPCPFLEDIKRINHMLFC